MDSLVYNIPASMIGAYRGRTVIVRSHDPAEVVGALSAEELTSVAYVQVLSVRSELEPLMHWGQGIPVDLVVQDPNVDLPLLYQCAPLLDRHAVRLTIPVVPGFSRVVKLAVALNFAVKLEVSQPAPPLLDELSQVAHSYLHQATVAQPIEFFHSLFLAFYRGDPVTLWSIQEEDPLHDRYITDEGEETLSRRFADSDLKGDLTTFVTRFTESLLAEKAECIGCEVLAHCSGYFKWPDREYRCDVVRTLFRTLKSAAEELRGDLAAFTSNGQEERS
jgi:hypothetical protein